MLKLGESSHSIDRGCCSILSQACLYTVDLLEKRGIATHCSASRKHMLIANFKKDVRRRSVKKLYILLCTCSNFNLLVWRNGSVPHL